MAKIDRYNGNMAAFAADALSTERTIFGDTAQSDTLDANITADFLRGWGVVGVNENPTKQDFNGLAFTLGQLLAYLHQRGVPEWNAAQEYYEGSVVTTLAGIYRLKSGGDGSSDPDTDGGVNWELAPTPVQSDITVTVGTGGDYPTINAALEYLSKLQPVYDFAGITATINLLSGFVMTEQVLVRGLDLGWITITGADAETTITNTALTTDFTTADYDFDSYPAFGVSKGGVLPRIDQLFRFDVANVGGDKDGIIAVGAGSSADVLAGAGVNDAGSNGILATRGSTINAEGANASGAGNNGISATRGSTINAGGADASGAGNNGFIASRGSTINADGANASGAGSDGIYATSGSTINAEGADASGAGTHGISAASGSTINADEADASGAGTHDIRAYRGSTINADGADASGAGDKGISASRGSTINADGADASGAENNGISASTGSNINAKGANASGAGGNGIFAYEGSTISANGATGTLSQTANTLTSNGIIFQ